MRQKSFYLYSMLLSMTRFGVGSSCLQVMPEQGTALCTVNYATTGVGTSTILLRSIKSCLPSLHLLRHSHDEISQALYRFSALKATVSWAGPRTWLSGRRVWLQTYSLIQKLVWLRPLTNTNPTSMPSIPSISNVSLMWCALIGVGSTRETSVVFSSFEVGCCYEELRKWFYHDVFLGLKLWIYCNLILSIYFWLWQGVIDYGYSKGTLYSVVWQPFCLLCGSESSLYKTNP